MASSVSFGKKVMENMGWKEGMGLGKDGQGMVTALRPKKKVDTTGLGAQSASSKWITTSCVYDSILAKLNVAYTEKGEPQDENNSADDLKSEKKRKREEKKAKKALKKAKREESEGSTRRHLIYAKRLKSKRMTAYSEQEKAEIFGLQARDERVVERVAMAATPSSVLFGIEFAAKENQEPLQAVSETDMDDEKVKSIDFENGFTEDTQVNIYNKAMDTSIKGRVGLGLGKKMSKSQRKTAAQQDASLIRSGSYLSRKFSFGGFLGDLVAEQHKHHEKRMEEKKELLVRRAAAVASRANGESPVAAESDQNPKAQEVKVKKAKKADKKRKRVEESDVEKTEPKKQKLSKEEKREAKRLKKLKKEKKEKRRLSSETKAKAV